MPLDITTDKSRLDLDVIYGYLTKSYWSPGISREKVATAIEHSLCWGLFEDDRQIGFARVVTDQSSFAYLADVFILPECQGRGLGKRLVEAVVADDRLRGLRRFMLATRDAHGLYEQYGFERVTDPSKLMEKGA
ncbi:GNAT family N-acetyltransferase [Saccharospirillum salsuginis]|uniref:N-acetyltransferase n=1 Tax=Saccharospirillum salsuginis TaxID=418750 RepID=A0A918NE57_9GAMM|nr:GNAT family N-acetyltransferase [Saccharospirillum salsuginis]GGX61389.1 N-acetyltransferase [Saccharospirillum salsuginis]